MSKPLIFLDFDGVLNTFATWGLYPSEKALDPDKIARVRALCHSCDAEVVISSAWRHVHSLEELRHMLHRRGGLEEDLVIGVTPEWASRSHTDRGLEIQKWLRDNKREECPFVILDDLHSGVFKGLESNHVQTTLKSGFTDEKLEEARENLRGQHAE